MGRALSIGVFSLIFAGSVCAGASLAPADDPASGSGAGNTASCPPKDYSSSLDGLSPQNLDTMNTAAQAAQQLPDDPAVSKAKATAQPGSCYQVTGQGSSGVHKLTLTDLTSQENAALSNPANPAHAQTAADVQSAVNAYMFLTDQNPCAPVKAAGSSGVAASTGACGPTTFDEYKTDLQSYSKSLDFNAQVELFSMLGNRLADLYKNTGDAETPLPTVFQSLITGAQDAGECRDIHEFLAVTASSIGLQDAGTTSTDWDNGDETGAHVVAQFKNPQTGDYVFVNYGDVIQSDSKYVTEASQQMAHVLNPYSTATQIETESGTGKPVLHETQDPRAQAIQNEISKGSDMNNPCHIQISVGNENGSVSVQKKIFGNANNNVGVFATGQYNQQGDPWQAATGGVRADLATTKQTSQNTQVNLKANAELGVLDVHDDGVQGINPGGRNETAVFGNINAEGDFAWNEKNNNGHVGIQAKAEDAVYLKDGLAAGNIPFTQVNVVAVDNPTKNLELHFTDSGWVANTTAQDTSIGYHHADDAVGAKVTKQLTRNISASTDVTVHDFDQKAVGIQDDTQVTLKTKHGKFSLGATIADLKNKSSDDFYDYPMTCGLEAQYKGKAPSKIARIFGKKATITANADVNCNQHDDYTLMPDDSLGGNPGGLLQQPKVSGGLTLSW